MTLTQTFERLDRLLDFHSRKARALIVANSKGAKCRRARDEAIGAGQVISLFARAVHRQIWK